MKKKPDTGPREFVDCNPGDEAEIIRLAQRARGDVEKFVALFNERFKHNPSMYSEKEVKGFNAAIRASLLRVTDLSSPDPEPAPNLSLEQQKVDK